MSDEFDILFLERTTMRKIILIICGIMLMSGNFAMAENNKVAKSTATAKKDYKIVIEKDKVGRQVKVKFVSPEGKEIKKLSPKKTIVSKNGRKAIYKNAETINIEKRTIEYKRSLLNSQGGVVWEKRWKNHPISMDPEDGFSGWFEGISDNAENSYFTYRDESGVYNLIIIDKNGKEIAKAEHAEMFWNIEISPDGKIVGAETSVLINKKHYKHLFFLEVDTGKTKLVKTEGKGWQGGFILSSGGPLILEKILLWFEKIGEPNSYKRVYIKFRDLPENLSELFQKGE